MSNLFQISVIKKNVERQILYDLVLRTFKTLKYINQNGFLLKISKSYTVLVDQTQQPLKNIQWYGHRYGLENPFFMGMEPEA